MLQKTCRKVADGRHSASEFASKRIALWLDWRYESGQQLIGLDARYYRGARHFEQCLQGMPLGRVRLLEEELPVDVDAPSLSAPGFAEIVGLWDSAEAAVKEAELFT